MDSSPGTTRRKPQAGRQGHPAGGPARAHRRPAHRRLDGRRPVLRRPAGAPAATSGPASSSSPTRRTPAPWCDCGTGGWPRPSRPGRVLESSATARHQGLPRRRPGAAPARRGAATGSPSPTSPATRSCGRVVRGAAGPAHRRRRRLGERQVHHRQPHPQALYDPSAGRVLVDGRDLADYTAGVLPGPDRRSPGHAPVRGDDQGEHPGTAPVRFEDIEAAARLANAHDFIMDLPEGYDTVVGERRRHACPVGSASASRSRGPRSATPRS